MIGIFRANMTFGWKLRFYRESFRWCGETFVIFRTPPYIWVEYNGWRVGHKRTGFRILAPEEVNGRWMRADYPTRAEAKEAALFVLRNKGRARVKRAIAKAVKMIAERDYAEADFA